MYKDILRGLILLILRVLFVKIKWLHYLLLHVQLEELLNNSLHNNTAWGLQICANTQDEIRGLGIV